MVPKKRGRPVSTTSCKTCKARRIKCDGMRPVCLRCIKANHRCDGFNMSKDMPHPSNFLTGDDARQLQYFQERVAGEIFGFYDMQFWQQDIPLLAANRHELYHIMVAIGFLHEGSNDSHYSDAAPTHWPACEKLALEHCNKAIRRLLSHKGESSSDKMAALAFCLLFIAAEVFQNRLSAAAKHLESGLAILTEWVSTFASSATRSEHNLMKAMEGVIRRFAESLQVRDSYADPSSPSPLSTSSSLLSKSQAQSGPAVLILPDTFTGPTSASTYLQAVIESVFPQPPHSGQDPVPLLKMWRTRYRRLEETLTSRANDLKNQRHMCFLDIHYLVVKILHDTSSSKSEMAYDEHVPTFQKIIERCAQIIEIERLQAQQSVATPRMVVSFDLGIIMPLYFTAARCRDHGVRCGAAHLLLHNPRREGIWLSWVTGRVAENLIAVEESGLESQPRECADVPPEKRVDLVEMRYGPRPVAAGAAATAAAQAGGEKSYGAPWFTPQMHLCYKRDGRDVLETLTVALPPTAEHRPGPQAYSVMLPRTWSLSHCKMLIGRKSLGGVLDVKPEVDLVEAG